MSHFAKLDSNNAVTEVIVAEKDFINSGVVGDEFLWIQTSYNNKFRGRFAGIGSIWDPINQVFMSQDLPDNYPEDGKFYEWNTSTNKWVIVSDGHGLVST